MNVVSGQDVQISTVLEVTVTHTGALSVATGAMLTYWHYIGLDSTGVLIVPARRAAGGTLQLSGQITLPYGVVISCRLH